MTARPHVLFVTYNGLLGPLGLRQGLAYLEPLTDEFDFTVLSFEKAEPSDGTSERGAMRDRLAGSGIVWIPLSYHARPSVPATLYDVWAGVRAARARHKARPVSLVHARGYIPAAIAWRMAASSGVPFLFDIRGLMADEYVDGGIWREGSFPYRLTRWAEARFLRTAAATVTLTEAIRPEIDRRIRASGRTGAPPPSATIPCCVDLDTFAPRPGLRARIRTEHALGDGPVIVYSGSLGTWYAAEPLVDFVAHMRLRAEGTRLLLVLNGSDEPVRRALAARDIPDQVAVTVHARPNEVPDYLAAADLGVAFIRPSPSKRASSPTKVAEYLASGLPVVLNRGVGDLDQLEGEPAVVLSSGLDPASLSAAADAAVELLGLETEIPRSLARKSYDLRAVGAARYRGIYRDLVGSADTVERTGGPST